MPGQTASRKLCVHFGACAWLVNKTARRVYVQLNSKNANFFSLTNLIDRREESLLFHGAWLRRQQNTKAFKTTQALPTVSLPTRSLAIFPQSGSEARSLQMQ